MATTALVRDLAELFEDQGMVFGGDAGTVIDDLDPGALMGLGEADDDLAAFRGEADRIGQQIDEHSADQALIAEQGEFTRCGQDPHRDALAIGAQGFDRSHDDCPQITFGGGQRHRAGFEPAHIEDMVDQAFQAARLDRRAIDELPQLIVDLALRALEEQLQITRETCQRRTHVVHDQVGQAVAQLLQLLELAVGGNRSVELPFPRQGVAAAQEQVLAIQRLGQEVIGPGGDSGEAILAFVQGGHKQDGNRGHCRISLDRPAQSQAIHPRKQDVEQDQIDAALAESLQCRHRVLDLDDVVAMPCQTAMEQGAIPGVIVDHQDGALARFQITAARLSPLAIQGAGQGEGPSRIQGHRLNPTCRGIVGPRGGLWLIEKEPRQVLQGRMDLVQIGGKLPAIADPGGAFADPLTGRNAVSENRSQGLAQQTADLEPIEPFEIRLGIDLVEGFRHHVGHPPGGGKQGAEITDDRTDQRRRAFILEHLAITDDGVDRGPHFVPEEAQMGADRLHPMTFDHLGPSIDRAARFIFHAHHLPGPTAPSSCPAAEAAPPAWPRPHRIQRHASPRLHRLRCGR